MLLIDLSHSRKKSTAVCDLPVKELRPNDSKLSICTRNNGHVLIPTCLF